MSKTTSFGTVERTGHDARTFYNRKIYTGTMPAKKTLQKAQPPDILDCIHPQDSRHMTHLPDNSVHLMVTSPPYNVGKDYDHDLSIEEYQNLLSEVMAEVDRVLVDGGRACVNIANVGRTPYLPLHHYVIEIAQTLGWYMRGEIIWDKGASAGQSCAWGSWKSASNPTLRDVHEYILVFCKNRFQRHPIGHNTIERDEFLEYTKSIWRFPTVSAKKVGHPAPFPVELPLRLIHLYSYTKDIVLDPFMGAGTTALAAQQAGRHFVGYEIREEYIALAKQRLNIMP